MRRKLIKQDAFEKITNESANSAERELVGALPILAKATGREHLKLRSFNQSTAMYETLDNTFIHAGYEIKNGNITFNNIEELVIDEASRREKRHEILSEIIDAALVDDFAKASETYIGGFMKHFRWNESKKENPFKKKDKKEKCKDDEEKKGLFMKKAKKAGNDLAEAYAVSMNVIGYVDHMKVGPTLAEATIKTDEKGNVTDIRIPSAKLRNESRLHRSEWKMLNSRIAEARKAVAQIAENQDFCKAIAQLKRSNSMSDLASVTEGLEKIVSVWPELICTTQDELCGMIHESLQTAGVRTFGDSDCEMLADAIHRTAHEAYSERAAQILHLASAPKLEEGADSYLHFRSVTENFFPALDQQFGLERKVFEDLYESIGVILKKADRQGDKALKNESASYLNELADALNGDTKLDIELAQEAAEFLSNIIETNLDSGKWVVSNTPYITKVGEHPDMAKKAQKSYSPSSDFSGNWGDELPAIGSDDMNYKSGKHAKQMRNDSWGQESEGKVKNPYVPQPFGDYTMKGDKGVDKVNKDFCLFKSKDTYPNLKNPYLLKDTKPKMTNNGDTDLVVER